MLSHQLVAVCCGRYVCFVFFFLGLPVVVGATAYWSILAPVCVYMLVLDAVRFTLLVEKIQAGHQRPRKSRRKAYLDNDDQQRPKLCVWWRRQTNKHLVEAVCVVKSKYQQQAVSYLPNRSSACGEIKIASNNHSAESPIVPAGWRAGAHEKPKRLTSTPFFYTMTINISPP